MSTALNAYLLREAFELGATAGMVVGVGPDELSGQAEVLAFFRKYGNAPNAPKGRIFGYYVVDKSYTQAKWTSLFSEDERVRIAEAKADIQQAGFAAFHKGPMTLPAPSGQKVSVISRKDLVNYFASKGLLPAEPDPKDLTTGLMKDAIKIGGSAFEEAIANPLHAGVHPDFEATATDDAWIQTAVVGAKTMGIEKWLGTMVRTLRTYFGGKPKRLVPHKNDKCTCGSGKKYGKCCGVGVEESDPEDCKLGLHDFTGDWSQTGVGKFIRGCSKCMKVEEAYHGDRVTLKNGAEVTLIGCNTCAKAPSIENAEEVVAAWSSWFRCAICDKPFSIKTAVCSHITKGDGTHESRWTLTSVTSTEDAQECRYYNEKEEELLALLHQSCFKESFKYAQAHGTMTAMRSKDGVFVARRAPEKT